MKLAMGGILKFYQVNSVINAHLFETKVTF